MLHNFTGLKDKNVIAVYCLTCNAFNSKSFLLASLTLSSKKTASESYLMGEIKIKQAKEDTRRTITNS